MFVWEYKSRVFLSFFNWFWSFGSNNKIKTKKFILTEPCFQLQMQFLRYNFDSLKKGRVIVTINIYLRWFYSNFAVLLCETKDQWRNRRNIGFVSLSLICYANYCYRNSKLGGFWWRTFLTSNNRSYWTVECCW